jgi:hypothetical protein
MIFNSSLLVSFFNFLLSTSAIRLAAKKLKLLRENAMPQKTPQHISDMAAGTVHVKVCSFLYKVVCHTDIHIDTNLQKFQELAYYT